MLIPFRSKAAGEFFMLESHAQALFELMDKPFAAQGIITASEVAQRLARLQAALNAPTNQATAQSQPISDADAQAVGLKQRAWPLLDMLTRAEQKKVDVTWGTTI